MDQRQLGSIILFEVGSTAEPVSWKRIMSEVERAGWSPTAKRNWLYVRGAVQLLIDEGFIKRVEDVRVEEYELAR